MRTLPKAIGTFVLMLFAALASAPSMAEHGGHGDGHGDRGDGHGWSHGDGHGWGHGDDRGWGHGDDRGWDHDHGGGHVRFGLTFGVPLFDPGYYSPYYDYPYPAYPAYAYPPVVVQSAPPVYVEQGAAQAAPAPAPADWYYCAASNSYYPYVSECPGGWQRVPARPPR
jgi:hypothetical protein